MNWLRNLFRRKPKVAPAAILPEPKCYPPMPRVYGASYSTSRSRAITRPIHSEPARTSDSSNDIAHAAMLGALFASSSAAPAPEPESCRASSFSSGGGGDFGGGGASGSWESSSSSYSSSDSSSSSYSSSSDSGSSSSYSGD